MLLSFRAAHDLDVCCPWAAPEAVPFPFRFMYFSMALSRLVVDSSLMFSTGFLFRFSLNILVESCLCGCFYGLCALCVRYSGLKTVCVFDGFAAFSVVRLPVFRTQIAHNSTQIRPLIVRLA